MSEAMYEARMPIPGDEVILTEFAADQGVLVDLNAKQYFLLNETALLVWNGIAKADTLPDVIAKMTSTYDVEQEEAEICVRRLLADLWANGLIH